MEGRKWAVKAYVDTALYQTSHHQAHVEKMTLSSFIDLALREALERRGVRVVSLAAIYEELDAQLKGQMTLEAVE